MSVMMKLTIEEIRTCEKVLIAAAQSKAMTFTDTEAFETMCKTTFVLRWLLGYNYASEDAARNDFPWTWSYLNQLQTTSELTN
jgi:hypothetical protein